MTNVSGQEGMAYVVRCKVEEHIAELPTVERIIILVLETFIEDQLSSDTVIARARAR